MSTFEGPTMIALAIVIESLFIYSGARKSACDHRHVAAGFRLLSTGVGAHRGKLVYVPGGWSANRSWTKAGCTAIMVREESLQDLIRD
jgi:hypothetical protein